eukprot:3955074-Lingulodinium_polyedra.AAC.1
MHPAETTTFVAVEQPATTMASGSKGEQLPVAACAAVTSGEEKAASEAAQNSPEEEEEQQLPEGDGEEEGAEAPEDG